MSLRLFNALEASKSIVSKVLPMLSLAITPFPADSMDHLLHKESCNLGALYDFDHVPPEPSFFL